MPSQTLSDKLKKGVRADRRMTQPAVGTFVPVSVRGRRAATGAHGAAVWEMVSVLVAIGVDDTGRREVVSVMEGMKEGKASWSRVHSVDDRMRSQGRVDRGRQSVHGPGGHGQRDATGRVLPVVHGPLHAQRAEQDQPQTHGVGHGNFLPAGGCRRGRDLPARRLSRGVPQEDSREQHD